MACLYACMYVRVLFMCVCLRMCVCVSVRCREHRITKRGFRCIELWDEQAMFRRHDISAHAVVVSRPSFVYSRACVGLVLVGVSFATDAFAFSSAFMHTLSRCHWFLICM